MKKLLLVLVALVVLAAGGAYWISTRVKMTVEHPETPPAQAEADAPKEDPALIQAIRSSLKTSDNDAVIAELLAKGADPNSLDLKGRPALYWAIANGDRATMEALVKAGADVNKADLEMKWPPLMHAAYHAARDEKLLPAVGFLLEKGADVNAGPTGITPLHIAVANGDEKKAGPAVVDLLLRKGANPNAAATPTEGMNGITPLMDAARSGKILIAKLLVKGGAKLDVKGPGGKTAFEIASEHKHPELAQALKVAAVVEKPKKAKSR
jgi:uncharacterized protein